MDAELLQFSSKFNPDRFFEGVDEAHQRKVTEELPAQLKASIPEDVPGDPARSEENRQLRAGIDEVVETRISKQVIYERALKPDGREQLLPDLEAELDSAHEGSAAFKEAALRAELLRWAADCPIQGDTRHGP